MEFGLKIIRQWKQKWHDGRLFFTKFPVDMFMISTGQRSSEEEDDEYDRMIRNVLLKGRDRQKETGMWGRDSERSTRQVEGGGGGGGREVTKLIKGWVLTKKDRADK